MIVLLDFCFVAGMSMGNGYEYVTETKIHGIAFLRYEIYITIFLVWLLR